MAKSSQSVPIGGVRFGEGEIEINVDLPTIKVKVRNTGDRPIQIGSHYHFFEVNRELEFNRAATFGMRLDIPATTGIRFEPGDEKEVTLVPYGGKQFIYGFYGIVNGWTGGTTGAFRPNFTHAMKLIEQLGFKSKK